MGTRLQSTQHSDCCLTSVCVGTRLQSTQHSDCCLTSVCVGTRLQSTQHSDCCLTSVCVGTRLQFTQHSDCCLTSVCVGGCSSLNTRTAVSHLFVWVAAVHSTLGLLFHICLCGWLQFTQHSDCCLTSVCTRLQFT